MRQLNHVIIMESSCGLNVADSAYYNFHMIGMS